MPDPVFLPELRPVDVDPGLRAVWEAAGWTGLAALPLASVGRRLWVAVPGDGDAAAAVAPVRRRAGGEVRVVVVPTSAWAAVRTALGWGSVREPGHAADALLPWAWPDDPEPAARAGALLDAAVRAGATDVILEAGERPGLDVLWRIEGVVEPLPPVLGEGAATVRDVLRSWSGLPPAGREPFAEGRATRFVDGRPVEFRVQRQATLAGEVQTWRILDPRRFGERVARLPFPPALAEGLRRFLDGPGGWLVFVGSTDSGKTTSLYALLAAERGRGRRILSLEDPVEHRLEGIAQVPFERAEGTVRPLRDAFLSALRSAPDLLAIGEIRTGEEARLAAEAALTGHRVLATFHAGDAAAARARFLHLGLPAATLDAAKPWFVTQRLVAGPDGRREAHFS